MVGIDCFQKREVDVCKLIVTGKTLVCPFIGLLKASSGAICVYNLQDITVKYNAGFMYL